jgi:hypothetical protein
MSDYRTTPDKFKEFIGTDNVARYFVPLESIGTPSDFACLEMEGLNSTLADDHVENGYLLADLNYEFALQDGVMGIKVSADASDYLNEIALNELS